MGFDADDAQAMPFTHKHVADRGLVLRMLRLEDSYIHGKEGKEIYTEPSNQAITSLVPEYTLHRLTLSHFGFDTSDESVRLYRSIFKHYYKSPTQYDKEVLDSVTYMRENKCVYYSKPVLCVGDTIPNCSLVKMDGVTRTTIFDLIGDKFRFAFIASFSTS